MIIMTKWLFSLSYCSYAKPLEHKPVPLQTGEEAEYMLALKQEFRGAMKTLPFYVRPAAPKKGPRFFPLSITTDVTD